MSFKKSVRRRRLNAERLEQRVVLAGNVDVVLNMTELSLVGDSDNNVIEVEEIAPNQIRVMGLAGTTINFGVMPVVFSAPLIDAVLAKMNDGDDRMVVKNVSLTDNADGVLRVDGGSGEDNFFIDNVKTTESIVVDMGEHDDVVRSRNTKTKSHQIATGNGSDSTAIEYFGAEKLELTSWEGDDKIVAKAGGVSKSMAVSSGPEHDKVALKNIQVGENLYVSTAQGDDTFLTKNIVVGNSMVVMTDVGNYDGNDLIYMKNAKIGDALKIVTERGDDTVELKKVLVGNVLKVDSGHGSDEVDFHKVKATRVIISTGDGSDHVNLKKVSAPDLLYVFQGDGEDWLKLEFCSSDSPEFNGGPGSDIFEVALNYFAALSSTYATSY
jgi:hypothetical protein